MSNFILDLFDNDERIVVNHITAETDLRKLGRKNMLDSLTMSVMLAGDEDVKKLVEGLKEKAESLTDEEWDSIKMMLPWDCDEGTPAEEWEAIEAAMEKGEV